MSETKFTPGPWKIVEDRVPSSLEVYGGTTAICECWRRANPETEIANANLIAAAPELYVVLDQIATDIESQGVLIEWHQVALDALAKARGEA
jgi:hypothetical protein